MPADGYYNGRIAEVDFEDDDYNKGGIVVCFKVELHDHADPVICRHRSHGTHADKTLDLIEAFGMPRDVRSLAKAGELIERDVRVVGKTSEKGRQNWYIATRRKPGSLTVDEVERRLGANDANSIF